MYRAGDDDGTGHGYGTGMSVDFMVPVGSAQGDQLAEYLTKNMNELGVYILSGNKDSICHNIIYIVQRTHGI